MSAPGWNKEWAKWREERLRIGREAYLLRQELARKERELRDNERRMPRSAR